MDRVRWCSDDFQRGVGAYPSEETPIIQQHGVRLYDGAQRFGFDNGLIILTTHRILWIARPNSGESFIALPLVAILSVTMESGGGLLRHRTPKIILRLLTQPALENALVALHNPLPWMDRWRKNLGGDAYVVVNSSAEDHIRLGFANGGEKDFFQALEETLKAKPWAATVGSTGLRACPGIAGIERQLAARAQATDARLEGAFEDLSKLMSQAKDMVELSHSLARRSREAKGGALSNDETAELRAAMLSMGVEAEEKNDTARMSQLSSTTSGAFHTQLAHQISELLTPVLTKMGDESRSKYRHMGTGYIDLASAYCRINRARGMTLISPEDMLKACRLLESERLSLRLKTFPSGLSVLHLASENEEETLQATAKLVEERSNLTASELSRIISLSPLLARERLLALEKLGLVCRDDTEAGLRFYPNLFLTRT